VQNLPASVAKHTWLLKIALTCLPPFGQDTST
jgi:hypothetical protein